MKIDFKDRFNNTILSRGYEYYTDGLVDDILIKGTTVTAKVHGSSVYDVSVELDDNEFLDGDCTCPYSESGFYCKHIAALLYYLENENLDENNSYNTKEQVIRNSLNKIKRSELDDFLIDLLIQDKNVYDEFRLRFNKSFPSLTIKDYKRKIYDAIASSAGRDGFIDYQEAWEYTHNMYKIIKEADILVDNLEYDLAFKVVRTILDTIPDTDIDDSDGSTTDVADSCIEIIEKILGVILTGKSSLSKKILDYILNETRTEHLSNYAIELYPLLDLYVKRSIYLDEIEKGLLESLEKGKTKKYFWNAKHYVDILINIYTKNSQKDKIINLLKTYSTDKSVCLKLVDIYLNEDNAKDAIDLLNTRLSEDNNREYANKLKYIYLKENMLEEYKDILYKLLFELDKYNIDIYKEIKALYSKKDWLKERENIITRIIKEDKTNWYLDKLLNIYIEEELYDDIYNVLKDKGMSTIMRYEKYLLPKYNKELMSIYIEYCKSFASKANNRKLYRELASNMRHIKDMKNSEKPYKDLVISLGEQLRNKSAMRDELKGLI